MTTEKQLNNLVGFRLLIVEDDYNIASSLSGRLKKLGATIIGPAGTVDSALALIDKNPLLNAALLDVHLGSETSFPIAEALFARKIPFIFTTGYSRSSVPPDYSGMPLVEKPIDSEALARMLVGIRSVH